MHSQGTTSFLLSMGLLASQSASVLAAPQPAADNAVSAISNNPAQYSFHGTHFDPTTETWFDLYSPKESSYNNGSALDSYWKNLDNSTVSDLQKRGFYDCTYYGRNSALKVAGCGTAHAIGAFVSATGAAAAGGYINSELQEAFNGKRDNQNPRSICITKDGDNLCTSWANYDTAKLKSGESGDIENFALKCGQSNGSAEFKATMSDGGILYICISDRAKGCDSNVCGQ